MEMGTKFFKKSTSQLQKGIRTVNDGLKRTPRSETIFGNWKPFDGKKWKKKMMENDGKMPFSSP